MAKPKKEWGKRNNLIESSACIKPRVTPGTEEKRRQLGVLLIS